jgi:mannosyl-oligosaccharide alpha-1,2-mannosidase
MTLLILCSAFASQPHRASTHVVLAEIGSLSVEFTRLAQLTKEPKYYDAVARITDLFEEWQNSTRLPGMWPTYIDASGCEKPAWKPSTASHADSLTVPEPDMNGVVKGSPTRFDYDRPNDVLPPRASQSVNMKSTPDVDESGHLYGPQVVPIDDKKPMIPLQKPDPITFEPGTPGKGKIGGWDNTNSDEIDTKDEHKTGLRKRQFDGMEPNDNVVKEARISASKASEIHKQAPRTTLSTAAAPSRTSAKCARQGFASPSETGHEQFTLAGMSDSTYEYLPKEWLLLGGLEEKYQAMYEYAMDTATKALIYRPMLKGNPNVLFAGSVTVGANPDIENLKIDYENAHLTCFAGGMYAMGAKIFDRPKDLEIGARLAEGCAVSYALTNSGIMPESFHVVGCNRTELAANDGECPYNETQWHEDLDPFAEGRWTSYQEQMDMYSSQVEQAMAQATESAISRKVKMMNQPTQPAMADPEETDAPARAKVTDIPVLSTDKTLKRRTLDESSETTNADSDYNDITPSRTKQQQVTLTEDEAESMINRTEVLEKLWKPSKPLTHEEKVEQRIKEERLPPGVTRIDSSKYILR